MEERVQKIMARANLGSRRACEEIINEGRVQVNGEIIQVGAKADPARDVIEVDGQRIEASKEENVYVVFHKPKNVLSTDLPHKSDDRQTVRELIPLEGHLFTIGRLDAESEGLMVLTNDGDLANRIAHPRYGHTKTYKVIVYGLPSAETLEKWQNGIHLEEGMSAPCYVRIVRGDRKLSTLEVVMTEGKKRQIRRVASQLGHPVKHLIRTHIGQLGIGTLRVGEWYHLRPHEVEALTTPADEARYIEKRRKSHRSKSRRPGSQRRGTPPQKKQDQKGNRKRSKK